MAKVEFTNGWGDKVSYEVTPEKESLVFNKVIDYCIKNNCFAGEVLQQDDDCLIEAPNLLSDIIDNIICFEEE